MFFKNLRLVRVHAKKPISVDSLITSLTPGMIPEIMSTEAQGMGWVTPRVNGPLVESQGKQFLIALGHEKKLLPTAVINEFTKIKADEIEDQQGFRPGRKQMKDIKEEITHSLMPRAFSIKTKTLIWIDLANGTLAVNSSSSSKVDDVIKLILKSVPDLSLESFNVNQSPKSAMTQWLQDDEAPFGFSVDSNSELRSTGEGTNKKVRFVNETIEVEDVRRHITSGKQCASLALTWDSKISFVLSEDLTIKKITPLAVLKESEQVLNDDERFDADFLLMTGELGRLLKDLTSSLGGFLEMQKTA